MVVLPVEKKIDWSRPPLVLIAVVLINILVFAFYQSGDTAIIDRAIEIYSQEGLDEIEYPAYKAFQESPNSDNRISQDDPYLSYYMLLDDEFREYIKANQTELISLNMRKKWRLSIVEVEGLLENVSYKELGLNSDNPTFVTILSHQFLHGDFWHLFGNMVFLLLTGFAVEAALGHGRFLTYYLISGIGASLLFIGVHNFSNGSAISLVGASGSISGVMAMYLALFKFRKIEFFYWLFIFTGYFRAMAIIILPAYILKELYFMMSTESSNVAYSAHIGGFITGLVLVLMTQVLAKQKIDTRYLDGDEEEEIDPYRVELDALYKVIAECDFIKSWTQLQVLKRKYPGKLELDDIQFNVLNALNKDKAKEFLLSKLKQEKTTVQQADALMEYWQNLKDIEKTELSIEHLSAFFRHSLMADKPKVAEGIFAQLRKRDVAAEELGILARKISLYYDGLGLDDLAIKYKSSAREIMQSAHAGV